MTRAWARALVAVLGTAVAASACGGSDYRYLGNDDAHAYFKLPKSWAVYDEGDILGQPALELRPLERERRLVSTWMRGFDAGPEPSPLNTVDLNGPSPRGYAEVRVLTETQREALNLSALRGIGIQAGDPIQIFREDPEGPVEVLNVEDVEFGDGYHGVRLEVATDYETDTIVVVDYTVLTDAQTNLLYSFVIGCQERCYFQNHNLIKEIADSWLIEEP